MLGSKTNLDYKEIDMDTINWEMVGALGQIMTALVATYVAYITYRYTKRQSNATIIKNLNDMVNEFNKACMLETNKEAVAIFRKSIIDPSTDALVFIYLNFLHTTHAMHRGKLIANDSYLSTMTNGISFLQNIDKGDLEKFLSRGYEYDFKEKVLEMFNNTAR